MGEVGSRRSFMKRLLGVSLAPALVSRRAAQGDIDDHGRDARTVVLAPDHLRGRLMGICALVFGGSLPAGSLWMGVIAQRVGSGHALQLGGLFCGLGASTVYFLGRKNRGQLSSRMQ